MENRIAIIGLGYVGLPLAVEFGKKYFTIGFDINQFRIDELISGVDRTLEISEDGLKGSTNLSFTTSTEVISNCNIYIITVPTPIDSHNRPDLTPLISASTTVGKVLKKGDIVIYESTVYPGCTEEDCVPILEKYSGLKFNTDFYCGYSPERINPGDKLHTLTKIKKITSGSSPEIADKVDQLYSSIIEAGTYKAETIKIAESAKVIENAQRDLNIAFVNELSKIFNLLNIDTQSVLNAAGTKWNFLPFKPGLVGGHCIGVDPFYLTHKAQEVGYHPEIILAGRRVNDGMAAYVASQLIKLMIKNGQKIDNAEVLILGITFKENCPDIRNTKVIDMIHELLDYGVKITVIDPWADINEVQHEYGIEIKNNIPESKFNAILLAVPHDKFKNINLNLYKNERAVIYDLKGILPISESNGRL